MTAIATIAAVAVAAPIVGPYVIGAAAIGAAGVAVYTAGQVAHSNNALEAARLGYNAQNNARQIEGPRARRNRLIEYPDSD